MPTSAGRKLSITRDSMYRAGIPAVLLFSLVNWLEVTAFALLLVADRNVTVASAG